MNISDTLVITKLINKLKHDNTDIDFTSLCEELKQKDENGIPKYYINIKENDDLFIVYYDNLPKNIDANHDQFANEIEKGTRSCIIEKSTLNIVASQFNRIIYNNDAKDFLKTIDWKHVYIEKCYEGTVLMVYNHNNKWYISTRRCIDASESTWVKNKSYKEMFDEAIQEKFSLSELNKNYCYYFTLVHHKNKNIINYSNLGYGNLYKDIIHIMTTEKYTLNEIDVTINNKVQKPETVEFNSLLELLNKLNEINKDNETKKLITTEGYVLRYYFGDIKSSRFIVLKLQTQIYQTLTKIKPNNNNMHQNYLELYQVDKLCDYLPYFTKYNNDIIKRIHLSMRTMAKELLDIYHNTRQKKNPEIYKHLRDQYKKILYGLHGLFIKYRKKEFDEEDENGEKILRSITVHDVYYFLKSIPPSQLRQLFYERIFLINEPAISNLFNKNCLDITTLSTLMFQNISHDDILYNDNQHYTELNENDNFSVESNTQNEKNNDMEIIVDIPIN